MPREKQVLLEVMSTSECLREVICAFLSNNDFPFSPSNSNTLAYCHEIFLIHFSISLNNTFQYQFKK